MSINQIIKDRVSVRTFKPTPLDEVVRHSLDSQLQEVSGPFGKSGRYLLVDSHDKKGEGLKLGTYGVIRGASTYVLAAIRNEGDKDVLMNLGYELEKFILFCTEQGLGTCWLGGTFGKSGFQEAMGLRPGERLAIVVPVGYSNEKRHAVEAIMRKLVGSDHRKEWNELYFKDNFNVPLGKKDAGEFAHALEMVRIGPSASNKQPWRVVMSKETKSDQKFRFYLKHTKGYGSSVGYDIQKVDIGIAMCHFEMSLLAAGIKGKFIMESQVEKPVEDSLEYMSTWVRV